ncbi:MAG: glycosyltransferase family 4 protein, partial [Desulfovibrionales bacterium]|nr:glycosyltransferase family 4 protein [Desulfovibrionales bacterium]
ANLLDTELWVAGSGKQDYEVQLRKHPCDPRIHFMGRVSPKDFYPHVDIVVVPSLLNDNLPGVVIESLAFGKPVIGSRRGGIPEMIVDGYNGLLFEPENLSDFAACLSKIYSDGDLYQYLEDNAKASSKQFLDVSRWIMKYEAVYSEVQRAPGL